MNTDEAVRRACEEPTLLKALSWICVWDCDRAVRQAAENQGGFETCFEVCIKAVMKAWGDGGAEARVADLERQCREANALLVELARRAARGRCGVHDEPLVLVWRCEDPANMNGAPRAVCPDCLEERAEKLEAGIRAEVDAIPDGVIVREDGAGEDVLASLAVSVGKTRSRVAALEGLYAAAVERLRDLGETEVPLAPRAAEATEAAVFVGEVSKDARPCSFGWKFRLFRPDAPHSYATVLSGRLFEGEREAVEDAEKVAREAGATVRRVVKASCVGSAWMEPEKVGR